MHFLVDVLITMCKAFQHATSSTTNPTLNCLVSNLGLRGVRPVSSLRKKHLLFSKHGIDFSVSLLDFMFQGLMLASYWTPQLCTIFWKLTFRFLYFTVRVWEFLLWCQSSVVAQPAMKYFLLYCACGVIIPQVLDSLHKIIRKRLFSSIETSLSLFRFHCSFGRDYL